MAIKKFLRDISNLFNYSTDENPTTQQDYQEAVKNWVHTIESLVDCGLWQPEKQCYAGDFLRTPSLSKGLFLECLETGVTGTAEPDFSEVMAGDEIVDGTAKFAVRTIATRELPELRILQRNKAHIIGDIVFSAALPSNQYLECIQSGTTGVINPSLADTQITDGTCVWSRKNFASKEYVDAVGHTKLSIVDSGYWQSENWYDWYNWSKYSDGTFKIRGYSVQRANVLGVSLTYPIPLIAAITANCAFVAARGTGATGQVSFTYDSNTVGWFTVRTATGDVPPWDAGFCYEVLGRWA